jgi:hypothetical protein
MLNKKKTEERGKCPFRNLKECSNECALYRKGVRFNEAKEESFPFEECALNIIADNLEAMHNRTYMLQKEVGDTKNVMAIKILSDLGMAQTSEVKRQAMKILNPDSDEGKVLIEDKTK